MQTNKLLLYLKVSVLISLITLIIGCSNVSNSNSLSSAFTNSVTSREIKESEVEHSGDIGKKNVNTNLHFNLELDKKAAEKKLYKETKLPYYLLSPNAHKAIKAQFNITASKDIKITLIALKGNKPLQLRIPGDKDWFSTLKYSYKGGNTATIPLEFEWAANGSFDELVLIPIVDSIPIMYTGEHGIAIRLPIITEISITKKMIQEQSFNVPLEQLSAWPLLKLLNKDGKEASLSNEGNTISSLEDYLSLALKKISYDTTADLIWFDELGHVKLLNSNLNIKKNEEKTIKFPVVTLKDFKTHQSQSRQFLLLINNRGQNIFADSEAFIQGEKPSITSFNLIIELFPIKD